MSDMTVGCVRTNVMPQQSGIYEALLEKAERERDEALDLSAALQLKCNMMQAALDDWDNAVKHVEADHAGEVHCGCVPVLRKLLTEARKESEEQARLLGKGGEREARLITERDHYKTSLESLLKSIDDWNDSMVKEPADDFIAAIAAYITEKLEK